MNRHLMVEEQIKARDVKDRSIINSMLKVERHAFVPLQYQGQAYNDYPLPIGYDQTISQPYIVAYMAEKISLSSGDRVLEIGTGSGYQAAVLAEIVKEVYTVEIIEPLADQARMLLNSLGYENVEVSCDDGYKGWREKAPFDAIIVTAAPETVPESLIEQLKIGGKMIIPVGEFFQDLCVITRTEDGYEKKSILPVRFVPMVKPKTASTF